MKSRIAWRSLRRRSLGPSGDDAPVRWRRLEEIPVWVVVLAAVMFAMMMAALSEKIWPTPLMFSEEPPAVDHAVGGQARN
jgi:hypothetical protein